MNDPIIESLFDVLQEARKKGHIDAIARILEIARAYSRDVTMLLPVLHASAAESLGYTDEAQAASEEYHGMAKEMFSQRRWTSMIAANVRFSKTSASWKIRIVSIKYMAALILSTTVASCGSSGPSTVKSRSAPSCVEEFRQASIRNVNRVPLNKVPDEEAWSFARFALSQPEREKAVKGVAVLSAIVDVSPRERDKAMRLVNARHRTAPDQNLQFVAEQIIRGKNKTKLVK